MYLSIRDAMVAGDEFPSPIAGLRHLAVEAVEVRLSQEYQVYAMDSKEMITLASDEDAAAYRKHLDGLGIRACCFMTAKDFSTGDRESNAAWVARAIELADIMGMSVVRIDSAMSKERELDFEKRVQLFAEGLGGALERTAGSKVALGIENHDRFTAQALAGMVQAAESPLVGICLDTVNSFGALEGPRVVVGTLAPWTVSLHIKDFAIRRVGHAMGFVVEGTPAGQGRLDVPWLLEALARARSIDAGNRHRQLAVITDAAGVARFVKVAVS